MQVSLIIRFDTWHHTRTGHHSQTGSRPAHHAPVHASKIPRTFPYHHMYIHNHSNKILLKILQKEAVVVLHNAQEQPPESRMVGVPQQVPVPVDFPATSNN